MKELKFCVKKLRGEIKGGSKNLAKGEIKGGIKNLAKGKGRAIFLSLL